MPSGLLFLLLIILGAIPSLFLLYKAQKAKNKHYWLSYVLRWLGTSLLLFLLFWPKFQSTSYEEILPEIIVLEDFSLSVKNAVSEEQILKKSTFLNYIKDKVKINHYYFGENVSSDFNAINNSQSAITNALQTLNAQELGKHTKGIILISDGVNNIGADINSLSEQLKLPVYCIGIGDSLRPVDIQIKQLFYNDIVSVNSDFEIVALINFQKVPAGSYEISLTQGGRTIQQKHIKYDGVQSFVEIGFITKLVQVGKYAYTVNIKPIAEEINTLNNSLSATIEATEVKIKTLLIYDEPHPDIKAISAALKSNEKFSVTTLHVKQQVDYKEYDLIIAHQVNIPAAADDKAKWIIGASNSSYSASMQNVKFNDQHHINQILSAYIKAIEQWPPIALGKNEFVGNPIISQGQPVWLINDNTQTLFTNGIGIWKWRMHNYKNYQNFDAFDQLVIQSLELLTLKQNKNPFILKGVKALYFANELINPSAYAINKLGQYDNSFTVDATLYNGEQLLETLQVNPIGNYYKIKMPALAAGTYTIKANVNIASKIYNIQQTFKVDSVNLEAMQTNADWNTLIQLAEQTNGKFVPIDSLNEHTLFDEQLLSITIQEKNTIKGLIDYKWLLAIVLAIFIIDGILRKYFYA